MTDRDTGNQAGSTRKHQGAIQNLKADASRCADARRYLRELEMMDAERKRVLFAIPLY